MFQPNPLNNSVMVSRCKLKFSDLVAFFCINCLFWTSQTAAADVERVQLTASRVLSLAKEDFYLSRSQSNQIVVLFLREVFEQLKPKDNPQPALTATSPLPGGINRIKGVFIDKATGGPAFVGLVDGNRPPLLVNDLLLALHCALEDESPFCSIDGPNAIALGPDWIKGTSFGASLLEADYLLKFLSSDEQICQRASITPLKSFYQEAIDESRMMSPSDVRSLIGGPGNHFKTRFWIEPGIVDAQSFGSVIYLNDFVVKVRYEHETGTPSPLDRIAIGRHTQEISDRFQNIADALPPLGRVGSLLELYLVSDVAVRANIIKKGQVPIELEVRDSIEYTSAEYQDFEVSGEGSGGIGNMTFKFPFGVAFTGGVVFRSNHPKLKPTVKMSASEALSINQTHQAGTTALSIEEFISLLGVKPSLLMPESFFAIDNDYFQFLTSLTTSENLLRIVNTTTGPLSTNSFLRAVLYISKGYFQNALQELQNGDGIPSDVQQHLAALCFLGLEKNNKGRELLMKAVAGNPSNLASRAVLVADLENRNESKQALSYINEILSAMPDNLSGIHMRAKANFSMKKYREAISDYDFYAGSDRFLTTEDVWEMAVCHRELGNRDKAAKLFQSFIDSGYGTRKQRKDAFASVKKLKEQRGK